MSLQSATSRPDDRETHTLTHALSPRDVPLSRTHTVSAGLFLWGQSATCLLPGEIEAEVRRASLTCQLLPFVPCVISRISIDSLVGSTLGVDELQPVSNCEREDSAHGQRLSFMIKRCLPRMLQDKSSREASFYDTPVETPQSSPSPRDRNNSGSICGTLISEGSVGKNANDTGWSNFSNKSSPRKSSVRKSLSFSLPSPFKRKTLAEAAANQALVDLIEANAQAEDDTETISNNDADEQEVKNREKEKFAKRVVWREPNSEERIHRQLMMDRVGALARSLGRPDRGIKQLNADQKDVKDIKDMKTIMGYAVRDTQPNNLHQGWMHFAFMHLMKRIDGKPEATCYNILLTVATVIALLGWDAYYLCASDPSNDEKILTLCFIVMCMFLVEFYSNCFCTTGYIGSFFFFLDTVSIASLMPEACMMWHIDLSSMLSFLDLARTGRAAHAGTRVARVVRLILSNLAVWRKMTSVKDVEENDHNQELQVGKVILTIICHRVVTIVFVMVVGCHLLAVGLPPVIFPRDLPSRSKTIETSLRYMTEALQVNGNRPSIEPFHAMSHAFVDALNGDAGFDSKCPLFKDSLRYGNTWQASDSSHCVVRYLRIANTTIWGVYGLSWEDLRDIPHEGVSVSLDSSLERMPYNMFADEDTQELPYTLLVVTAIHAEKIVSMQSVGLVLVISFVLLLSTMLLGKDIDVLVIAPLETMTRMVKLLSDNPMAQVKSTTFAGLESGEGETRMIASALIKLSSMLQIAFGTAGASIIASNLDNSSQEQAIQPIVPGRRMMGIFGFCDVRNFTNATECLQEDIMVYINCIAEYAHTAVSDNGGFPNKNVGDAFLMAWPLTEGAWTSQTLGVKTSVQESAESALRALLRVILETSCSHILRRMSSNPELQKRIPGFRTELGFGLHIGWAIEGAIGSAEKVDPSYLSPDVEMSMKLEAATKHYGVSILLTNNFYDVLPHNIQQLCRCIDRVQEPGSRTPVDLYTYDFNSFSVQSGKMPTVLGKPEKSFWDQFPPSTSANFRATFATAMRHYTNGYWNSAKEFLDMCLLEEPKDLATQRLIEVLAHHDFEAPANWKGFREVSGNSFGPYDPDEKSFHTASFRKTSVAASLASESSLQSQDTPKRVTSRAEFGYSQL